MSAWVGIRPLASSSPPDVRTAEPNGAAQVFSQTSTAAAVPGSSVAPISSILLGEQDREVALERAQLADLAVVGIAQLGRHDRAVFGLHDHHQVEHPIVLLWIIFLSSDPIAPEKFALSAGNPTTR